ncbi:MAG: TonB-dependent receptor [Cyclobacteriaceae bacterium]|nr:TonB-dependent receptor [Cyclobacteriaceae bacterium]
MKAIQQLKHKVQRFVSSRKTLATIILMSLLSTHILAQTRIAGLITDQSGQPLIGANVFVKDTYDGASTDVNGKYTFETSAKGEIILVATYIGYEETTLKTTLSASAKATGGTQKTTNNAINFSLKELINKMEAVVISAGSFEAGTNTKSEVLKPLDIVTTAGATADIAGALNTLPGTQTVGEEGRLFVRGGDGSETKTFIDGLQVLKPYSTTIPNTPTRGRFSPFMFSGTSFSTGGYSAEYGQALSSALILNTKEKPAQTRTDLSLMTVGAELSHTQSWAKSSIAVQGAYYNLAPYNSVVTQSIDWVKPSETIQANLAARQQVGNNGILKVYGNISANQLSMYQYNILNPTIKTPLTIKNNYVYGNASLKNTLGNSWVYKTGVSYTLNTDDITLENETIIETTKGVHLKTTFSGDLTNKISLNTGAELLYSESKQEYSRETDGFKNIDSYQNPLISGFAEADIYFSNNFLARVGGRVEYTSLNKQVYVAPRVSLAYKTGENAQVALAGGSFQQAATEDLLRINNALDFEKADHLILNYQVVNAKQTFRIEGYLKQYRDLVKFNPNEPLNPIAYTNTGSGYARGIDLFWRDNKTIKNADYWVSYSYLDTERDFRNFPTQAVPTFASTHNLSVVYKQWINSLKTQFSGTFSYASPRTYNNPNTAYFNAELTPAYVDLSLSISYLATQSIIIYGSVTNVLGRDNIFGYEYSATPNNQGTYVARANMLPAPRFFFVGVFITFSKDSTLNQLRSL